MDEVNDKLQNENYTLLKLIEPNKLNVDGLKALYNEKQIKIKMLLLNYKKKR